MAVNKKFTFTIDVTHSLTNEQFQVIEGDSGNKLDIYVVDDGVAVDLTATRVVMIFSKGASLAMQDTTLGGGVTVDSSVSNLLHVDLYNGSFVPGLIECSVQVYSGEGLDTLITTGSFNFRCVRALLTDSTIRSLNEYNILQSLISEVQGITSNAQSDWNELDPLSRHFIKNKPSAFNPTTHASNHSEGGSDPISPESIGAMSADATYEDIGAAPSTHANQHKTGGADAISPHDIGAANRASAVLASLSSSGWTADGEGYAQTVNVSGVTTTSNIVVSPAVSAYDKYAECGIRAVQQYDGQVKFYAADVPDETLGVCVLIVD